MATSLANILIDLRVYPISFYAFLGLADPQYLYNGSGR
jgi:hypothetical protein